MSINENIYIIEDRKELIELVYVHPKMCKVEYGCHLYKDPDIPVKSKLEIFKQNRCVPN